MTELSDKLLFAVDYQGGRNVDGALNVDFSWNFAKKLLGYLWL